MSRKKGFKLSKETKKKISHAIKGKNNGMWKGNEITYGSLHDWIRRNLHKPDFCLQCKEKQPYDVVSIGHKYTRDLREWIWLCRKCHMILENRLNILHKKNIKGRWQYCVQCYKIHWVVPNEWNNGNGKYCSHSCANKGRTLIQNAGRK